MLIHRVVIKTKHASILQSLQIKVCHQIEQKHRTNTSTETDNKSR